MGRFTSTFGIVAAVLVGFQLAGVSPVLVVGMALAAFGMGLLIWSIRASERLRSSTTIPMLEFIAAELEPFPVERRR